MASTPPLPTTADTSQKPMMKARYSEIVAINFSIDERILAPLVPKGLEIDRYNGDAYVSLIAMMLRGIKVWGLPFSVIPSSPELSLRFYARKKGGDDSEKGAVLIKDYIAGGSAAWLLEARFGSDFERLKIKQNNSGFGDSKSKTPEAEYLWKVGDHWNKLRVKARERVTKTGANTKVGFILGHSTYYGTVNGKTVAYKVEHPKWEIWDAAQANFTCDVRQLFGKKFIKPLGKRPSSVFVSSGSPVTIYRPEPLK